MKKILTPEEFYDVKRSLLGNKFSVLSKGSIEFIDAMGSDARVVEAARTTSNVNAPSEDKDIGLLRFLMRHRHGTPFEMPHVLLKITCPMDTWRQWIRHRTANVNEFSTRYSNVPDDNFDVTPPDAWRTQAKSNRQGSSGNVVSDYPEGYELCPEFPYVALPHEGQEFIDGDEEGGEGRPYVNLYTEHESEMSAGHYLTQRERNLHTAAREVYKERVEKFGVAKEQARKDLPLSTYTVAYWQCDLRNLFGFLSLRMDGHAQWEIRQYANIIGREIVAKLYPVSWQAFLDYDLNSMRLTALDIEVIQKLTTKVAQDQPETIATFMACQHESWVGLTECRERDECLAKLQKLNLVRAA